MEWIKNVFRCSGKKKHISNNCKRLKGVSKMKSELEITWSNPPISLMKNLITILTYPQPEKMRKSNNYQNYTTYRIIVHMWKILWYIQEE